MPQQHSRGGEDDGPPDETKTYHTEGEQEEKASENVVGPRESFDHLNDVKSSLIDEGESESQKGSSSQRNKRLGPSYGDHSKEDRHKKLHAVSDGSKGDHIARFTPYGSLAFITSAGYPNGSMVAGPGIAPKCGVPNVFPSPLRLGEGQKMPVLHPAGPYPPSLAHLMMYNQEHYPPGTPPPHLRGMEVDSKTGILRRSHSEIPPYHPLSPGSLGQVSHHLEVYNMPWQGQPFYPLTSSALRSPYPPSLAASPASMARLGPSPITTGPVHMGSLPHSLMNPMGSSQQQDAQQQSNDRHQKEKEKKAAIEASKKSHIKKPLNAFMLYMKEMRASVVKECTLKESAAINQILGRRWHALSREEQAKYYELARKERQLHMQLYPGWSARDNYACNGGKKKKKKRDKTHGENSGEPSTPKKCRARFGVDQQEFWCKPCRRKKKCIRYISSDENDHGKNDDDDMDDDQSDASPGPPTPRSDRPPVNSHPPPPPSQESIVSPTQNGVHSRPLPHSNGSHSSGTQSNGDPPTHLKGPAPSCSSSHSSTNSLKTLSQNTRDTHTDSPKHTDTSRILFTPHTQTSSVATSSSQPPSIPSMSQHIPHPSQQPLVAQTSPTIVHLPHPAAASYPSLSSAGPPMVMFSPQASLLAHPTAGMHDAFRPHLTNGFAPHGLLPMHHPQGMPPPLLASQRLRLPTSEMPQDLSMKSGTVTA